MRATLAVLAAILLIAAGGASVVAADLIGGTLTASAVEVTVTSQSTIPVRVALHVDGAFTVSPDTFSLAPAETRKATVSGTPEGTVSATMTAFSAPQGVDGASVTLQATLRPYVPPPVTPPWGTYGLVGLLGLAVMLVIRRLRPWRWRIVTVAP